MVCSERQCAAYRFMDSEPARGSDEHPLDAAGIRTPHVLRQPVGAEQVPGNLDDDVVRIDPGVIVVAFQSLQARRAGREYLDLARDAVAANLEDAVANFLLLAKSDLR